MPGLTPLGPGPTPWPVSIPSIRGVQPPAPLRGVAPIRSEEGVSASFGEHLARAVDRADGRAIGAETTVGDLLSGRAENAHDVMIRLEEAHLALQWTVQIRNRALEAYNEVLRMPL